MKIRALRVTTTGQVRDIDLGSNELHTLQEAVGGFVEAVTLSERLTLWCNEEGKLIGLPPNPMAQKVWWAHYPTSNDTIVGDIVLSGGTDDEGNTISLTYDELLTIAAFLQFDREQPTPKPSTYNVWEAEYCKHGTYVGDPCGPDYLCGLCESGY